MSSSSLERAREELDAARTLAEAGFPAQAVSRADDGAFFAAEAALLTVDDLVERWITERTH